MRSGVQLGNNISEERISEAGFEYIELNWNEAKNIDTAGMNLQVSGIEFNLVDADEHGLYDVLLFASKVGAEYIVINTLGCNNSDDLFSLIDDSSDMIADLGINVYIENGLVGDDARGYVYGAFSESNAILDVVNYGNRLCDRELFGVAVSIGHANLLQRNIPAFIYAMSDKVKLIHMNDNDSKNNLYQMPYTFTSGRSAWMTEWNKILGVLIKIKFDGWVIYNTKGLWENMPDSVKPSLLKLQKSIITRWEKQFRFEDEVLSRPNKKIILFGSGAMAVNYMENWKDKYKPYFIVDNNSKLWGLKLQDVEVRNPKDILEISEGERTVIICNMHYNEIRAQLTGMGVEYEYYNDEFYPVLN